MMKCSIRLELVARAETSPEPDLLDRTTRYVELNYDLELPFAPYLGLLIQFPRGRTAPENRERVKQARSTGVFVNPILRARSVYYQVNDNTFHLIATEHFADPGKVRAAMEQWVYGYGFSGPVDHHRYAVWCAADEGDTERLRVLFDRYIEVLDLQGAAGALALQAAAGRNHLSTVEMLLDAGVPAGAVEPGWDTALQRAVGRGYLEVARTLIAAGADVDARRQSGVTALISTAVHGHPEVTHELLRAGADPNLRGPRGGTALTRGAENGHTEVVRLLLRAGADPTIPNDAGDTPLTLALRAGHTEAAALLTKAENDRP